MLIILRRNAMKENDYIPENSDMANYKSKNNSSPDKARVTNIKKTELGYEISLTPLSDQRGGLRGLVPHGMDFEPKEGMFAIWDGAHTVNANVNLSFYDEDGKRLFEMKRRGEKNWEKVYSHTNSAENLSENAANSLQRIRKHLAQDVDKEFGTKLSDVKLPKVVKKIEAVASKFLKIGQER